MYRYLAVIFLGTAGAAAAQQLSMSDRLALRDNCKEDIKTLCPAIQPGGGKLMTCVEQNRDKLSKACATTIADLAAKRKN